MRTTAGADLDVFEASPVTRGCVLGTEGKKLSGVSVDLMGTWGRWRGSRADEVGDEDSGEAGVAGVGALVLAVVNGVVEGGGEEES